MQSMVNNMNLFSYKIYKELCKENEGNMFFSPFSIYMALSVLNNGTSEHIRKELEEKLGLSSDLHKNNVDMRALTNLLIKDEAKIKVCNKVVYRKGITLQKNIYSDFEKPIKKYYNAYLEKAEFHKKDTYKELNKFVELSTDGFVKAFFKDIKETKKEMNEIVCMILNVIYFKGEWKNKFEKYHTYKFYGRKGKKNVKGMLKSSKYNFCENKDFQMVSIEYKGNTIMDIILSKDEKRKKGLFEMEEMYINDFLYDRKNFQKKELELIIPKFEYETEKIDIKKVLKKLGIHSLFEGSALDKIVEGIFVDKIEHKAKIKVNEEGTESSAETMITAVRGVTKQTKTKLCVDRPFEIVIREKNTNAILFMGKFEDI